MPSKLATATQQSRFWSFRNPKLVTWQIGKTKEHLNKTFKVPYQWKLHLQVLKGKRRRVMAF